MLRALPCVAAVSLVTSISPTQANAASWDAFNKCLRDHVPAVDQAEPSILNGAELVVRILCIEESTNLANELVAENPNTVGQHGGFGGAFSSYLTVMEREAAKALFEARKARLNN